MGIIQGKYLVKELKITGARKPKFGVYELIGSGIPLLIEVASTEANAYRFVACKLVQDSIRRNELRGVV